LGDGGCEEILTRDAPQHLASRARDDASPCRLGVRYSDTLKCDDRIGLRIRDASVVCGIGVLPMFADLLGLLLVGSLTLTRAREGR
jgi:hypothetical protein